MPWSSILCLMESLAFARAGGGEHYSGGSAYSGASSFSSGGSGLGLGHSRHADGRMFFEMLAAYARWAEANPLLGIPATFLILYVVIRLMSAGHDRHVRRTISRGLEARADTRLQSGLAALRRRDPGFDPEAFLARVRGAFLKVQEAWCAQDMSPARAFISDGVMERFSIQLAMQMARGRRDLMENVEVLEARLLTADSGPQFDALHVSLRASAVDQEVSLADGSPLGGAARSRDFVEVWSFLRRPGAKTLGRPGLMEGQCPGCGAILRIKDAARCGSCDSWVSSGEYDWVLAEITQAWEWTPREPGREIPGWPLLAADDPGLSVQALEDRASAVFWRWQHALWDSDAEPLRAVACDSFCAELTAGLKEKPARHEDAAVGAVTLLAVEPGDPFDRAHAMVKWSAGGCVFQHVLVLGRRRGVKTDERFGLSSMRCAACGAPAESRSAAACASCAKPFNDGRRGWILLELIPADLWKSPQFAGAAPAPPAAGPWDAALAPIDALAALVCAVTADGRVEPAEMELLQSYASARRIAPEVAERVIAAANAGTLKIPNPETPEGVRAVLGGLIRMSLADGSISEGELGLLNSYAGARGLGLEAVRSAIQEERLALYREAKQALAQR